MKLSDMRAVLATAGIRLTKSLGQNFLHDGNQLRRIAQAAGLNHQDRVLEIGPGLGPLTELLLANSREVLAIEKDGRLVELLRSRFGGHPKLRLLQEDALAYCRRTEVDWSEWKMVSNLPYSVASPLLVELARTAQCPSRMVATVQLEVAQRAVAQPGDEAYGILSLLIQIRYEPRLAFKIPASCFFPAPEVDSACLTLQRRDRFALSEEQMPAFKQIVKRSFGQRRKMMMKLLRQDWPAERLEEAYTRLGLEQTVRAEALALKQFTELTRLLGPLSRCQP